MQDLTGKVVQSALERTGAVPFVPFGSAKRGRDARRLRIELIRNSRGGFWFETVPLLFLTVAGLLSLTVGMYFRILDSLFVALISIPIGIHGLCKYWRSPSLGLDDDQVVEIFLSFSRCPSCFYDLGPQLKLGDEPATCPECGAVWSRNLRRGGPTPDGSHSVPSTAKEKSR